MAGFMVQEDVFLEDLPTFWKVLAVPGANWVNHQI
jgi:hypothetical protein